MRRGDTNGLNYGRRNTNTNKRWRKIIDTEYINERSIKTTILVNRQHINLMSVYFPHSECADHHIEKMYKTQKIKWKERTPQQQQKQKAHLLTLKRKRPKEEARSAAAQQITNGVVKLNTSIDVKTGGRLHPVEVMMKRNAVNETGLQGSDCRINAHTRS